MLNGIERPWKLARIFGYFRWKLESSRASGLCGRGPSLFFLLLLRDDAAALPPPSLLVGLVLGILFWYYSALFILVLISPPLLVAVCGIPLTL